MATQCKAKTKKGTRCKAYAVDGGEFCFTHSPTRAKDRAVRNRKGGLARSIPKTSEDTDAPRIVNSDDVLSLVNWVIADTWELENTAPRSRALLAAAAQAIECLQIGELEKRVQALEQRLSDGSSG